MGFQQSQIQKHEMLYKQAILTSNNLQFMGKTSKAKQKQKIQSPVSEDQCDENSGYTADFFNEEQLMELKQKESKQKILDHIKKQGILGKQTYKDVKILLKKKFGADTINIHKNWLVSTLNSRKSDSKAATPTNKRKKNSNKKNTKPSTCQGEQNIDGKSNQSQTSLTPSKNEDQSIITGMDYQSLQSDLKHTETEFSQIHSDTTFPELNQIDELIEKKLGELTQKARDDISNMILKQVPELLQTPQFQNLTDQIKESCDRVTKLESLLKSVDYEQISREVAEGREEIQQTFQILVEDIKKVAPTLGVATQESMARNVRRINDQIVELQKTIKDSTNGFKNMEDNLKILTAQDSEQVNLLEINIADVQKKLKCVVDTFNETIEECKENITKNMNIIHENIKIINTRVTNIEKRSIMQKREQVTSVQQHQSQPFIQPQIQQQNINSSNAQNPQTTIQDAIQKYNQHDPKIQFLKIGNQYLHDGTSKQFILVDEQADD